jgi:hypothetical protein
MPTHDPRFIDLQKAAESKTYAEELKGKLFYGLEITELSTHLQGQLVAVHPAYDDLLMLLHLKRTWKSKSKTRMGRATTSKASTNLSAF